jgi:hypothetical protein
MPELDEWDSFYVIVGSSAGALVGLQFVVMTLLAERPPARVAEASAAFASPTTVHFSAVLLLSAILRAPWQSAATIAAVWSAVALAGLLYSVVVVRRMRGQGAYQPTFEDWLCHAILPFVGYAGLAAAAAGARAQLREALFGVGAVALLLLFIGIHNAWDAVTYQVAQRATNTE